MDKIVLKYTGEAMTYFIVLDGMVDFDVRTLNQLNREDAIVELEMASVPYELWDRPTDVPRF